MLIGGYHVPQLGDFASRGEIRCSGSCFPTILPLAECREPPLSALSPSCCSLRGWSTGGSQPPWDGLGRGGRTHGEKFRASSDQRTGGSEENPGKEWGLKGVKRQKPALPFTGGEGGSERGVAWLRGHRQLLQSCARAEPWVS